MRLGLGVVVAVLVAFSAPAPALALTGAEVMNRLDKHNRAEDEVVEATMQIVSARGHRRIRKMTASFKSKSNDDDLILIRFTAPPDMRGSGLLTIEQGDADQQWLYLSELRRSKRIAGSSKANSFVGSDFSNYDMRTEDLQNHTYKLVGEESVAGRKCHKVEAVPNDDDTEESTGYSRRLLWVDSERWVALKVEFYDRNGKLLKELVCSEFRQLKGLWRAHKLEMTNRQEGSKTLLFYAGKRLVNEGLADREFSKRALENP